jgi:predicted nuclease of predicted toxin-antitoxin system
VRLKLDENLPHDLADELTRQGHDVDTVLDEQLGGHKDSVVVQAATDNDRMVITLDRGVGDIRNFPPGSHAGVVVLRPASQDPASILELVGRLLDAFSKRSTRTPPRSSGDDVRGGPCDPCHHLT